jgi:RND family efflux transporter MFP subunit
MSRVDANRDPAGESAWWRAGGAALALLIFLPACREAKVGLTAVGKSAKAGVSLERASDRSWSEAWEATAGLQPIRRAMPGTILMGRVEAVVHQAEAGAAAARAQEENARLTRDRIRRLHERDAASQKNLDDADSGYEAAAAGLKAAEEGVEAARVMKSYSRITAPFPGVIVEKRIEEGDTAAPGMPLFVIEDTSRMKLEASVPESWLVRLKVGSPVEVAAEAAGFESRRGTLAEILPAVDPRSRTLTVRVLLDNPDRSLRSGMFARLRIPGEVRSALAVPEAALVRRGPLTGVFVVDESKTARLRWVTVGSRQDSWVEVLTGLKAGERFVASPDADLEDGTRVEER